MSSTPIPQPSTTEVEVKLGDGSVVKGANLEEAFKNLSEMKVNASTAIKEKSDLYEKEKTERERIENELNELRQAHEALKNPPKPPTPTDATKFNKDTYFQLLGEDPMKAQDYLDAYRFGLEAPEQVRDTFNGMRQGLDSVRQQVDAFTQQSVTMSFLAQHPEYPQGDNDAAKKLTNRVSQLTKDGFPYSAQTIEFAYYQLVNSDDIKPIEIKEDDKNNVTVVETPNPSLTGATQLSEEAQKAETLSDAELLKLLQAKGMFR